MYLCLCVCGYQATSSYQFFPRISSPFCFFAFLGSLCFPLTRQQSYAFCWGPNSSLVFGKELKSHVHPASERRPRLRGVYNPTLFSMGLARMALASIEESERVTDGVRVAALFGGPGWGSLSKPGVERITSLKIKGCNQRSSSPEAPLTIPSVGLLSRFCNSSRTRPAPRLSWKGGRIVGVAKGISFFRAKSWGYPSAEASGSPCLTQTPARSLLRA